MPDIVEIFTSFIEQLRLLPPEGMVIVAVSGGADSLCLLHLLNRLCGPGKRYEQVRLHAAHLNHRLRGEASARDADALAAIVAAWGLPFTAGDADVAALARDEHRSLEDAARLARYSFLRAVMREQGARAIAVAHHADDQVETLLLHWLRGSGLPGMVGMLPVQGDIIRPLLAISHAQTLAYCQQHGIEPIEDLSNADLAYTRNRVRHQLLPLLESLNPGFRAMLLRSSDVISADLQFIEAQVDAAWPAVVIMTEQRDAITLDIPALLQLPIALQRHLLRRVTARLSSGQSPLELRHYALIDDLFQRVADRQPRVLHLPRGIRLTRAMHAATFSASPRESDPVGLPDEAAREARLSIPGQVMVPGTSWMAQAELLAGDLEARVKDALRREDWAQVWNLLPTSRYVVYVDAGSVGMELYVRTRQPGDRLQPLGMASEKKVQDILVDARIARAERASIPLFFSASSSHCAWLGGVCLDQRARLTSATGRIARLSLVPL